LRAVSRRRIAAIGIGIAAIAGLVLRIWVYRSELGSPDSDEAVVGLMARHLLHGQFTVFYWGQPYGGPQEALLTAPVFAVAGSSLFTLRITTLLLTGVAALLIWRIGRRIGGELLGVTAALLFWLWPPFDVMWLVHERGFYASDVAYAALLILLGLRIVERPSPLRVGLFGLVLGLGFWQTAQIIPVALPLVAWIVWRAPRALRASWAGVIGLVVGALPWLIWNALHDWESVMPRASFAQYRESLRLFASPLLPMLLGLRAPLTGEALLPKALMYIGYVALLAAFAFGAVRLWRTNASLLFVLAIAFPLIWAISRRVSSETGKPIFLVVVTPVLVLLVALLARGPKSAAVVLIVACAVSVVTLHRMQVWFRTDVDQFPPSTPRSLAPLEATLRRLGVSRVYANYWIAYRLAFDSDERIIATNDQFDHAVVRDGQVTPVPSPDVRYRDYQRRVAASRHGFVFFRADEANTPIVPLLRRRGYRRVVVGPFVVFAP
jgi:4-amino-4-deoxy-L-arabinose transferase-like glycosyltransferase